MATRHSTGSCPAFAPSIPIRPSVIRGRLCHVVAGVAFTSFKQAATAWAAAEAQRLDVADELDQLIVRRTAALAAMRAAARDRTVFAEAAKREAALSAEIRRLRRQGGES